MKNNFEDKVKNIINEDITSTLKKALDKLYSAQQDPANDGKKGKLLTVAIFNLRNTIDDLNRLKQEKIF
jgi:hypothetical protein